MSNRLRRSSGGLARFFRVSLLSLATLVGALHGPVSVTQASSKGDQGPRTLRALEPTSTKIAQSSDEASTSVAVARADDGIVAGAGGGHRFILASSFQCGSALPVCSFEDAVLRYDEATGAFVDFFIDVLEPYGMAIHPLRETLLVASRGGDRVNEYNAETGAFIRTFVAPASGNLRSPQHILFKDDGNLLVTSTPDINFLSRVNGINEYNGNTGAFVRIFKNGGSISPILPEDCGDAHCIRGANGMAINPVNGRLYVNCDVNDKIIILDATTGNYIDVIQNAKVIDPAFMLFRPIGTTRAGNLLITSEFPVVSPGDADSVIEIDYNTKQVVTQGINDFVSGIFDPGAMMWHSSGSFLHADRSILNSPPNFADRLVLRNPLTGAFQSILTPTTDNRLHTTTALLTVGADFATCDDDNDGDSDLKDFAAFARCFGRHPSTNCRNVFDDNLSKSIGYVDFAVFRRTFVGPPVPCSTNQDCNDDNPCTTDTCNVGTGVCSHAAVPNGTNCADSLFCDGVETCTNGLCLGMAPCIDQAHCNEAGDTCIECLNNAECDDGNVCTTDSCQSGTCVHSNNTLACSDGNECTINDRCSVGTCVGGPPRTCNDNNMCTNDSCNPAIGCQFIHNTNSCDDGNPCTTGDQCLLGQCRGGPPPVCNDNNPCTDDSCNPAGGGCAFTRDDTNVCDDGNACTTVDVCQNKVCVGTTPLNCDDGVPCTTDSCSGGVCSHTPNNAFCNDGLFCTGIETCNATLNCVSTGDPCLQGEFCDDETDTCVECAVNGDCDDSVGCTEDTCVDGSCDYTPNDANCPDNGLFCDGTEVCDAVNDCVSINPPCEGMPCDEDIDACGECQGDQDCDDGVACTVDTCNLGDNTCEHAPDNGVCDDGLFCNGAETCDLVNDCQAGTAVTCDDGVGCTTDACNETTDACENTPDDGACDDGLFCNGTETCDAINDCQAGTAVSCDDGVGCTTDACNETTDACDNTPDDSACNDGSFCNGAETCDLVNDCQAGSAVDCDDGVGCTTDACNETTDACDNTPDDGACDDGAFCNGAETCDTINDCQAGTSPVCDDGLQCTVDTCDGSLNDCRFTPINSRCNDLDACTDDVCTVGVGCEYSFNTAPCDDGFPCTENDMCDGAGICASGTPKDCSGLTDTCNDGVCNASTGACEAQPANEGGGCDDGLFCTVNDSCQSGFCLGDSRDCTAFDSTCTIGACDEGGTTCFADPTNEGGGCDDGLFCTVNDSCVSGSCLGDPRDCTAFDSTCTIGACDEGGTTCFADPTNEGGGCDDGLFCTVNDSCESGTCLGDPRDCTAFDSTCTIGACDEGGTTCFADPTNEGGGCDDGLFCTVNDSCESGTCLGDPRDCTAFDSTCTIGACDEGGTTCFADPINENNACDDGLFCTVNDSCSSGDCLGDPRDCTALDSDCSIGMCDEGGTTCFADPINQGGSCDGDSGTCNGGVCVPNE